MPPRLPPSAFEEVATSKGYRWLGPYVRTNEPTNWECPRGHHRFVDYNHFRNTNCGQCRNLARSLPRGSHLTIQDYDQIAAEKGWTFVGPLPNRTDIKTTWQCAAGHPVMLDYDHLKQGIGCPICSKHERQTVDHYHALAAELNIAWLGQTPPRNTRTLTRWKCTAGHIFDRRFDNMRTYRTQPERSCPICTGMLPASGPENRIAATLDALSIPYEIQKRFSNCKLKKLLPFDFYLPEQNVLIEYHGEQHYRPTGYGGGRTTPQARQRLAAVQRRDSIKAAYTQAHGITLLVILYTDPQPETTLRNFLTPT